MTFPDLLQSSTWVYVPSLARNYLSRVIDRIRSREAHLTSQTLRTFRICVSLRLKCYVPALWFSPHMHTALWSEWEKHFCYALQWKQYFNPFYNYSPRSPLSFSKNTSAYQAAKMSHLSWEVMINDLSKCISWVNERWVLSGVTHDAEVDEDWKALTRQRHTLLFKY